MSITVLDRNGRARVVMPLPPGRRGGRMLMEAFHRDRSAEEIAGMVGRLRARKPGERKDRGVIVADVVSPNGAAIVSEALMALVLEIIAALVLLTLGVIFWRMSVNAEQARAQAAREREQNAKQLARDRQLKVLGQMSAVLGHELRNPIASLKGNAQLLLEMAEPGDKIYRGLVTVVEEAKLLEQLTNNVLDFARTGSVDPGEVSLGDLVEEVIDGETLGRVELSIAPPDLTFFLDRGRIAQSLANLLRNARQASGPEQSIILRVFLRGDSLIIQVVDRGPGIQEDHLDQVFEPFFTTRIEGVGLGLALVRRLAEAHGGTARVQNNPAGGATFELEFPRVAATGGIHG